MAKGATQGTLAQLTAELWKRTSKFDGLLEEIDRRHEVNREGGLTEWVSRNLLLTLRWLGSSAEAGSHFHPASVWLGSEDSTPPPAGVAEALSELPTLVGRLVDALRPIFLQEHNNYYSGRRPSDLANKLLSSVSNFNRNKATLDLVIYQVVQATCHLRTYHLQRLSQALPTYLNHPSGTSSLDLGTEPGAQLLLHLPVCTGWDKAPAASGKLQRLEIPCRAKLEEMKGISGESDLKLCMFAQVGCGEVIDSDEEGQWEGYTVRVNVSVSERAQISYQGLQLTISSMSPGCEIKGIRTTLDNYESEEWRESNDVMITLPTIDPGHQHDLLVLGSVRSVGLVELVLHVGAAPWTREDHRRLRLSLATASGVELDQLRFAEVGDVDEDGCAGVLCAFPDHSHPRTAQSTLLNVLSDCSSPGDRGLPYAVKYFGAAQPTTPDIGAQLKFRFQHLNQSGDMTPPKARGRAVAFSTTKDVGDTLSEGVCLAERWGQHSARVREEVFRQNLCTVLDRVNTANDEGNSKWQSELVKTLTSPLYDHPLSELRRTQLVKELLWIALGGVVDSMDPNERTVIINSLRLQQHVANNAPVNPAKEARHTLFQSHTSEVIQGLHQASVVVNDELQRMNRFLEIAKMDLPLKELHVEEDADRSHVANSEYEERIAILRGRRLTATPGKNSTGRKSTKKEKATDYQIHSPIRTTKSPVSKKRAPSKKVTKGEKETPTKKKKSTKEKDTGRVPIWQRTYPAYHSQHTRSSSQASTGSRGKSSRSMTPESRMQTGMTRTGSTTRTRSKQRKDDRDLRMNALCSVRSQLRRPTPTRKKTKSLSPPPTSMGSRSRSRSRSVERDLSADVLRSPVNSFSSSKRSSRWGGIDAASKSSYINSGRVARSGSKVNFSMNQPPSPFGKTQRAKKQLQRKTEDVVGPWLDNKNEAMATPPTMPLVSPRRSSRSPVRFHSVRQFPYALRERVCVKCGISNVKEIFTSVGLEWRDNRERYVGCPGEVTGINYTEMSIEITFDPAAVPTHNTRDKAMVWPIQAVEAEATSPVPSRVSPPRMLFASPNSPVSPQGRHSTPRKRHTSPHGKHSLAVSDSPPSMNRRGKQGGGQVKRAARLASLFSSPAAAIVAAIAAAASS